MAKKSKRTQKHFGAGKMKPPDKINPFEVRINKQRHDVIGRKKKQDTGLPGIARNKAMKKRETTILQEYLLKNKNSKFLDKRIGENIPTLNKEDKIMARFSREMKKRFKKSTMYNLNDDEELTHLGRTIGEIEKFDDPHSESDEEGKLDSDFVKKVHFGGFETDERMLKRTHKERMDDMISESKRRKYEKKMENEVNVDLTEKLDQEWKSVANLLNKSKRIEETTEKSVDDYDIKVRELKFEAKGRPSDRLKSAEEIVAEENEKLRKLEEERIARMKGNTVKTQNSKHISADDLCDGFALDEDSHSDADDKTPASKENDDDKTNFEKTPSDDDDDDDSDNYSDVLSDETLDSDDESESKSSLRISKEKAKQDLPYVFPVPSTLDEFLEMLAGRTSSDQAVIVDRIIKCNHPSLGSDNRMKLETFFIILLQFAHDVACDSESDVELLEIIIPHFLTLLRLSKKVISASLLDVMKEMQEKFQKKSRKSYPEFGTLYLFKIISVLYPTSDFRHPLVTPAMIFMSQLLAKCPTNSFNDAACCLFLCETFFDYVSLSKRFVPEAVNSLHNVLCFITKNCPAGSSILQVGKLNLLDIIHSKETTTSANIAVVSHAIRIVSKFSGLYEELSSFSEVFDPILQLVKQFQINQEEIQQDVLTLTDQLEKPHAKSVLILQRKKPKLLKQYEPRYQAVFTGRKERVGGKKKLERQKLVHKYKREMKGAIREIRQDNQFLANRHLRDQLQKDQERKRKVKELYAELAQQEGDFKRLTKKSKLISM